VVLVLSSLSCVNIYNFPSIPEAFRCLVLQQILFIGAVVFGLIYRAGALSPGIKIRIKTQPIWVQHVYAGAAVGRRAINVGVN
jgi:hypothetical protein